MTAQMTAQPLLDVSDLTVEFATRRGIVKAVQHVNIAVGKGETLGIVGESGSGKSVTSYAVMRILDRAGKIADGSVMFSGIDVKGATENQMRDLRGREISMIFQNPRAALNPIRKVGDQIEDVLRQHVQSAASDRGRAILTASSASIAFSVTSEGAAFTCSSRTSSICRPTLRIGFSAARGFWKIIDISRPRRPRLRPP